MLAPRRPRQPPVRPRGARCRNSSTESLIAAGVTTAAGSDDRGGGYVETSRPASPGGGSVPGTPRSSTCSVHSDPDQYRCSCRLVGSTSQPGAIPVNVDWPEEAPAGSDARRAVVGSVNELARGAPCLP